VFNNNLIFCTMKTNLFIINILIVILFLFGACKPQIQLYTNRLPQTEIKIDGKVGDWGSILWFYDEKSNIYYAVTNDKNNLYIGLKADDQFAQMKIMQGGLDVYIDTTSKISDKMGISFPVPGKKTKDDLPRFQPGMGNFDPGQMRSGAIKKMNTIKIYGFPHEKDGVLPLENNTDISAAIDWNKDNLLSYEARIPFKSFTKNTLVANDSTKSLMIGLKLKGVASDLSRGGGARMGGEGMGGGSRGGMGSGSRGGMGGAPGGGMPNGGQEQGNMQTLNKTNKIWIKTKLAY
jgi:hypothetical protein